MNVEYTDAPATRPEPSAGDTMPCPYCGHLLPKDAQSCDRCDWTRAATTETAEGKASDAVAVLFSIFSGFGDIYKGHILAGFFLVVGGVPGGGFVFLAGHLSAPGGVGVVFLFSPPL